MSDAFRTLNPNAKSAPGYTYDAVNNKLIARFTPPDATNKVRSRLDYIFMRGLTPKTVVIPNNFKFDSPDGNKGIDLSDRYPLDGEFSYQL